MYDFDICDVFCKTFAVSKIRELKAALHVLLGKSVLKICTKVRGEHPCRSVISIKLLCNFIEITFF